MVTSRRLHQAAKVDRGARARARAAFADLQNARVWLNAERPKRPGEDDEPQAQP